jgi:NitT/TauT family transport system permease protein
MAAKGGVYGQVRVLAGQFAFVVLAMAGLEGFVRSGLVSELFVARPTAIFQAFGKTFLKEVLPAAGTTLAEIAVSLALSMMLGLVIGYLLWRFNDIGRAYEVVLGALFAAPTLLLYPIALAFFGRTPTAVIALAASVGVIPVILNTRQALLRVNPVLIRVGRSLRLSDQRIFRAVLLPAAAPGIFSGLQLGLGYMFKAVLAMEFIVNIGGLGRLVAESYDLLDTKEMYAGIMAVVLVAILYVSFLNRVEHGLQRAH